LYSDIKPAPAIARWRYQRARVLGNYAAVGFGKELFVDKNFDLKDALATTMGGVLTYHMEW
jgi:hypothetical protein